MSSPEGHPPGGRRLAGRRKSMQMLLATSSESGPPSNLVMPAHILKAGFLRMKAVSFPYLSKNRFFQLHVEPQRLMYLSEKETLETEEMPIDGNVQIDSGGGGGSSNNFTVTGGDQRVWHLTAATPEEASEWIKCIGDVQTVYTERLATKCTVLREAIRDLQETLVFGHREYTGVAFVRQQEVDAGERALEVLRQAIDVYEQATPAGKRPLIQLILDDYRECLRRGAELVDGLRGRCYAQVAIERFRAEHVGTEIALKKGPAALEQARSYWQKALEILAEMKADEKLQNETDFLHFLSEFEAGDVERNMNQVLEEMEAKRRPSIIKSNTLQLDRALHAWKQAIKVCSARFQGRTFLSAKKVDNATEKGETFRQLLAQAKGDKDMDGLLEKYDVAAVEFHHANVALARRLEVHKCIEQLHQCVTNTRLFIGGRDQIKARQEWSHHDSIMRELQRLKDNTLFSDEVVKPCEFHKELLPALEGYLNDIEFVFNDDVAKSQQINAQLATTHTKEEEKS